MGSYNSAKRLSQGAARPLASTGAASLLFASVLAICFAQLSYGAPIVANLQPADNNPNLLQDPNSYTIAQIVQAGGIIIGDKLFDSFTVVTTKSQNAFAPGIAEIAITPIQILKPDAPLGGDFGMKFNGPWSAPAQQFADSTIQFRASILQEYRNMGYAFKDNALWITAFGVSNNVNGGAVSVSENLYVNPPSSMEPPFVNKLVYYLNPNDQQLSDVKTFAPIQEMWVVKDVIAYGGTGTVGLAHLSEFYQTFSQTPEPGTLVLLAIGALGIVAYAWRKRR